MATSILQRPTRRMLVAEEWLSIVLTFGTENVSAG